MERVAAEEVPRPLQVAVRVAHGELSQATDPALVVVPGAVHAVDAHLLLVTGRTRFAVPPSRSHGAVDAVEAVGTGLALDALGSLWSGGVRAGPARLALAIRCSVGVCADGAGETDTVRSVLVLAVVAGEAVGFVRIGDLPLVDALEARRHAGVWRIRLLADALCARARGGDVGVLARDAYAAGCRSGGGEVARLARKACANGGCSGGGRVKSRRTICADRHTSRRLVLARLALRACTFPGSGLVVARAAICACGSASGRELAYLTLGIAVVLSLRSLIISRDTVCACGSASGRELAYLT